MQELLVVWSEIFSESQQATTPSPHKKDSYCRYQVHNREIAWESPAPAPFPNSCTGTGDCKPGGYHNLTALATKYYVPKEAIPVGNQDFEDKKKSFATTNGFNNIRFDHIHRAELDYLNGKPGETYENPYTHQPSKYDQLNISRNNAYTQAVNNTNQKAIRQIWNPSNATGQYSDDVRSTLDLSKVKNRVNSTEVFNGGILPKLQNRPRMGLHRTELEMYWCYRLGPRSILV
nr:hypothetical protein [Halobacterium salinarum]WOY07752.1 hypothetical protein QSJ49_13260 [Halobacterium salinarum]